MPIGTNDFLIDAGNNLSRLGYEFTIVARERGNTKTWACLCNAPKKEVGREMLASLEHTLDHRFGDDQPWKSPT